MCATVGSSSGGANGANRLSGNAITEALAFGRRAGRNAADDALASGTLRWDGAKHDGHWYTRGPSRLDFNPAQMLVELQALMADEVGPFRTEAGLQRALKRLMAMRAQVGEVPPKGTGGLDCVRVDWFDLFQMLLVAEVVTRAALLRTESRGAHQREDFPGLDESWRINQVVTTDGSQLNFVRRAVPASVPIPDSTELV